MGNGISTIRATVYDSNYNALGQGGPWVCDAGSGTITGDLAGSDRSVVITAYITDTVVFWGELSDLILISGQANNVGTILVSPVASIPSVTRYQLRYVSGDNQTWGGGGMPYPMVFRVYDKLDEQFVEAVFGGLVMSTSGTVGRDDGGWSWGSSSASLPYDLTTVSNYWYVDVCNPLPPFDFELSINAIDSITGDHIDNSPYLINHTIARSDSYC